MPADRWTSFATLVLEGAYEATMWAAALNAARFGTNVVFLTQLGGGAFGNRPSWIHSAIRRALNKVRGLALDVRIVSRQAPDADIVRLVDDTARRDESDAGDGEWALEPAYIGAHASAPRHPRSPRP